MSTDDLGALIARTADAIRTSNAARSTYEAARVAMEDANIKEREAWTALRDAQDEQVAAALRAAAPQPEEEAKP